MKGWKLWTVVPAIVIITLLGGAVVFAVSQSSSRTALEPCRAPLCGDRPGVSNPPPAGRTVPTPANAKAGPTPGPTPGSNPSELGISAAHLSLVVFSLPSIDDRGAIGQNQSEYHDLGFQRPFGNRVVHGLVQQDVNEVSSAILAIEYSFAHQNPDGSFRVVQISGASYQLNTHNVVGVSFFYADLGHALGLFQESQWFQTSSATATLRARLEGLRQKIRSGLDWLSAPEQQPQVQNTGRRDTNRWTFGAEAYLLVGQWLNDSSAISIGEGLLKGVEGNQQPDGTILEKGGFDSGYQSVSLNNLFHIYLHLGSGLTTLKPDLWNEIRKGLAREQQAVLSSGQMSHVGNTRTYCGGEAFRGKPKEGGGHDLARVLTYMYGLTNNEALLTAAETTVAYYANHSHSLC